ncbi:MAG TPA: hypothetical protein VFW98_13280 [Gemmatimonadaceae bacterium]|nr:hypothetical protein [Gemmatimonadaceae bacterium]
MDTPRRDTRSDDPQPAPAPHEERRTIAPRQNVAIDASEDAIDEAIEMTFPASDPPAWTAS